MWTKDGVALPTTAIATLIVINDAVDQVRLFVRGDEPRAPARGLLFILYACLTRDDAPVKNRRRVGIPIAYGRV